ncbi:hypothetical protein [Bradyrhizobium sp. LHD-71]|uniref:hypothetical protein n=1 Tax=Bradyrhizobium sp. LHD-71 TaxID=3072141 RepID=UPI0028104D72|nr:hypothetical protein [Bradyrhizobium sp. LHD-71]MDQ8732757.1 hypothetical protein [Bradyrhizobium sp. LHD-71]
MNATRVADFVPHNNPCAQCGKPIATPVWVEPGKGCVTYVWVCCACDYEFTSTAVFAVEREQHPLAA